MEHESGPILARRYQLSGRVQGVGVRPAIVRLAGRLGLAGRVWNDTAGVSIVVEGSHSALDTFGARLGTSLPGPAFVEQMEQSHADATGLSEFVVIEQPDDSTRENPLGVALPLDRGVCEDCLREMSDPADRRFRYPFTHCAQCGPRYSILTSMPYERRFSSMAVFPMCAACRSEHDSADDRRFHAQTICCPACGPRIWLESAGHSASFNSDGMRARHASDAPVNQAAAVERAAAVLSAGGILAHRGVGGYQLLCEATNDATINRLRQSKCRPTKPLAVMVGSMTEAERLCRLDDAERAALTDASNPIVLARARDEGGFAAGIHPGLRDIGVMLPTTPLHTLLLNDSGRPLVVTSGNPGGDPLPSAVADAREISRESADAVLHHDREIEHRIDDSVVRVIAGRRVTFRLARGLAPHPLPLGPLLPDGNSPVGISMAALGGHQKSAIAVSNGRQAILGPHLGDLDSPATRRRLRENFRELTTLLRCNPQVLVHDLHPDYDSTRFAQESSHRTLAVQHHHAHVVAAMIEQRWLDREVLGVAFDGTGFGPDGTIWGGEFLRCTASGFQRVAQLRTFQLPGGERAIREPWCVAVSLLTELDGKSSRGERPRWSDVTLSEAEVVANLVRSHRLSGSRFSPITSSVGRLFDAAAALILDCTHADEEGRPAMLLESACDERENGLYGFDIVEAPVLTLDWSPMLHELIADRNGGVAAGRMAMRFHRGLAVGVARVCERFPDLPVVLAGGVFQNRLLTELLAEQLHAAGRTVGLPGTIPPNDGGLAAGQLAIALARLAAEERT